MNWWTILAPIVAEIVKRLLERKGEGMTAKASAAEAGDCDRWAAQLEAAVHDQQLKGVAAPGDGLIKVVTDLIAALNAHDWIKMAALIQDLFSRL